MVSEKECTKCKNIKPAESFHKCSMFKSGLKSWCKVCVLSNEKLKRKLGTSKCKERSAKYRLRNPDKRKETIKKYVNSENGKIRIGVGPLSYRFRLKQATLKPYKWHALLNKFQKLAELRTKETGIKHSVDHIVPLKHELMSGLNVPWNIQIIPLIENFKKGNRV